MQITGIILAGGKSTRMGTDKVLLKVNEKTLLDRAIELVQPFCNSILISSNNPEHKKSGYEIVPDEIKDCGPIGGIFSCLKESKMDWNFVISVDSAFVEMEFIQHLISEIEDGNVIIPVHSKGKEPLIALYNKSSLPVIKSMVKSGNYKMYNLLNELKAKYVNSQNWVEKYPDLFRNLNRPEDLKLSTKH